MNRETWLVKYQRTRRFIIPPMTQDYCSIEAPPLPSLCHSSFTLVSGRLMGTSTWAPDRQLITSARVMQHCDMSKSCSIFSFFLSLDRMVTLSLDLNEKVCAIYTHWSQFVWQMQGSSHLLLRRLGTSRNKHNISWRSCRPAVESVCKGSLHRLSCLVVLLLSIFLPELCNPWLQIS